MILEIKELDFSYASGRPVLQGILLDIEAGKVTSIVGPNGSGKTTLLKCTNKILKPKDGVIFLDGENIAGINLKQLARHMAYVPQSVHSSFSLTVFDTIFLGRRSHINMVLSERDKDIAAQTLVDFGLEDLAFRLYSELSSGEKQKVLMARAIAQEPRVLLLDEPTSNLDLRHQIDLLKIAKHMAERQSIAVIMAIHDLNLAARFSDKMVMMERGRLYAEGTPADVLTEENVKKVYGVATRIIKDTELGYPHILPLDTI